MADRERTITHLKAYVNCYADRHKACNQNCALYGHGDCVKYFIESINDVLELLKEQEPIKPTLSYSTYRCGVCEGIVGMATIKGVPGYKNKYCHECGRPVKWDD